MVGNFVTFYKPYTDEKLEVRLCPIETKQSFEMCFYMRPNSKDQNFKRSNNLIGQKLEKPKNFRLRKYSFFGHIFGFMGFSANRIIRPFENSVSWFSIFRSKIVLESLESFLGGYPLRQSFRSCQALSKNILDRSCGQKVIQQNCSWRKTT